MNSENQFHERLAAIHGLNTMNVMEADATDTRDIRHEEFQAMADTFLGSDYDRAKLDRVESLQVALDRDHSSLLRRFDAGDLSPEEYVDAFNDKLSRMFEKIERTLGANDFVKLFGAPPHELGGFIDKETFLQSRQSGDVPSLSSGQKVEEPVTRLTEVVVDESSTLAAYGNFARVTATPEEVIVDFGLNPQPFAGGRQYIKVSQRVIMNFFTAKRFLGALQVTIQRHEAAFGAMELDVARRAMMPVPASAARV